MYAAVHSQMHSIGWEDCMCDLCFLFLFLTQPYWQLHAIFRGPFTWCLIFTPKWVWLSWCKISINTFTFFSFSLSYFSFVIVPCGVGGVCLWYNHVCTACAVCVHTVCLWCVCGAWWQYHLIYFMCFLMYVLFMCMLLDVCVLLDVLFNVCCLLYICAVWWVCAV